jgi:hypothetical protein
MDARLWTQRAGPLVFGDYELKRAFLFIQGLAVHGIGDDHVSGMEAGIGLG